MILMTASTRFISTEKTAEKIVALQKSCDPEPDPCPVSSAATSKYWIGMMIAA